MTEPTVRDNVRVSGSKFESRVESDGTNTVAKLSNYGSPSVSAAFTTGVARRRKGDPRNNHLGELLALARAHQKMADALFAEAEKRLR